MNLVSGMEIGIKDLVDIIARITGFEAEIVWDTSTPDGEPRRCLDASGVERLAGFGAKTPFEEGLRKTTEWYLQVRNEPPSHLAQARGLRKGCEGQTSDSLA